MAEYEETVGQRREDFGDVSYNDAEPLVLTLGQNRCGLWLEGEVLLDQLPCRAEEMIVAFDLDDAWLWYWEQDYHSERLPDEAALQAPHLVR